jgi:integrase
MPEMAVTQLRQLQQAEHRNTGPVFATRDGGELDAANVRREFRTVVKAAGIAGNWSPRELRHTFVSLMSDSGVPVEEIARLAGHANSRTTEVVYRHQLRPVMEEGAEAMDRLHRSGLTSLLAEHGRTVGELRQVMLAADPAGCQLHATAAPGAA